MQRTFTITDTIASFFIALTVVMSGAHAKDLAAHSLPALHADTQKQADDQRMVKIATSELHNHVDKPLKAQTSDPAYQADNRSLRLLQHNKKEPQNKFTDTLRFWWELSSLYLS